MNLTPEIDRHAHDLKSVYYDFKIVTELLKAKYPFSPEELNETVAQLEKALAILKRQLCAGNIGGKR